MRLTKWGALMSLAFMFVASVSAVPRQPPTLSSGSLLPTVYSLRQDTGPAMPASADTTTPKPPAPVLQSLRKGAIWLRFEPHQIGRETVWVLVSVVPVARNKYSPYAPPKGTNPPITRKDVFEGMALEPSPFYVDVWAKSKEGWTKLQSASYRDEADVANISVKYLRPREKTGPILFIDGGFTHWKQWVLVGFPDGVRGKRVFTQTFLWGGEGEFYIDQTFAQTDARGFLQVNERSKTDEKSPEERHIYTWDGERFTNKQARYFVIVAATKTKAEADDFVRQHNLQAEAEVVRTNRFPRLIPNLYIVVIKRTRTLSEANAYAKAYKSAAPNTYVKQAF